MTRSLYEDNDSSRLTRNDFGNRQLFRRPAPPSEAAGELPWARRKLVGTQTITSNDNTPVNFDTDCNDYTDNFSIVTSSGFESIQVLEPGFYSVLCRVVFTSVTPTEWMIDVNVFQGGGIDELYTYVASISQFAVQQRDSAFAHFCIRLADLSTVGMQVAQQSGSGKDIGEGTFLEVLRLSGDVTTDCIDW